MKSFSKLKENIDTLRQKQRDAVSKFKSAPNPSVDREKPKERELLDEDEVRAGVEYGKRDSQDTRTGARKTGTDALKIDINTGYSGGQSGGVNV